MGIPRFAYRMRDYARSEVLREWEAKEGREESQHTEERKLAIVDGPSLAHSLLQTDTRNASPDCGISPSYNYSDLGKAAVEWLDTLQSHGSEVGGIYFDGALPVHKKQTRISRLQQHVEKLTQFKRVHDEVEKAEKKRDFTKPASDWRNSQLKLLRNDLAAPPFLVFAIVEALLESHYSDRTWVIPGEADPFCAAAALEAASLEPNSAITIFTNDSDLIVYQSRENVQVAIIDTIEKRKIENGLVLEAAVFRPYELANMAKPRLTDLIRPVYEMLDPDVSFKQAIVRSKTELESKEYEDFSKCYSLEGTAERLQDIRKCREKGISSLQLDSRVSELYHQTLQIAKSNSAVSTASDESETDQRDLVPGTLDMYLPMLFEDPSRSSAWKIGGLFRNAAETLLLSHSGLETSSVLEHRKSGNNILAVSQKKLFATELGECFQRWTTRIRGESRKNDQLAGLNRWRCLIMQFTLSDMSSEGTTLPNAQDIASVLAGASATTWRLVHLRAQYQAEYYSVRMLKQVLSLSPSDAVEAVEAKKLKEQIVGLPSISQFFDVDSNVDNDSWLSMAEGYLAEIRG